MPSHSTAAKAAWGAVSIAALALCACTPPHPHWRAHERLRAVTRLDCPSSPDGLELKTAAADGRSCAYTGPGGTQVALQLVDLNGQDASEALAPITADLRTEVPAAAKSAAPGGDKDRVDIDLPGIHIHASGEGDRRGSASASSDSSNVTIGGPGQGVVVDANDNGAEVHVKSGHGGEHLAWILSSDTAGPHGFKLVSYDARGPAGGPLVVAVLKSPTAEVDDTRHAIRELLRVNVGE